MSGKKKDSMKETFKAFSEIGSSHNLPEEVVQDALKEAMEKAYQKHTGIKDMAVKTTFENGKLHIYHVLPIVEECTDDMLEISLEDARKKDPNAQIGGEIYEEVDFTDFDRGAVVLAKNVMKQKIREAEKGIVYENYKDKKDELVNGYIKRNEEKYVLVLLGGTPDGQQQAGSTLAMMKHSDQIPTETYREDTMIPVVITEVNKESKGALVLVSRSSPTLIRRLFEKEVPEIYNGIIEIKNIARDPGARAKIAVMSHNENIDPIGACIGPRGTRVQSISSELNGEKIDILEWSDDLQQLVANALQPAQEVIVLPKEDGSKKSLYAVVPDNQLSLAIGKRGQNARLAVKLTGYKIDIKSQSQMEELGIDYRALADAMHREYEDAKAAERAYKQQQRIDELRSSTDDGMGIESVDFTYADELEPDDRHLADMETLANTTAAASADTDEKQTAPQEDEMEMLARKAKENRKSLAEKRSEYVSRLEPSEPAAPAPAVSARPAEKKVSEPKQDKKPAVKKPSFAAIKPIYTEEELREIEENELEEELSASWNEDVDYEEYDEYYDDEY